MIEQKTFAVPASDLSAGDEFYGVASGKGEHRPWPKGMPIEVVGRDGNRVVVDFGSGIVRKYASNRLVFARKVRAE